MEPTAPKTSGFFGKISLSNPWTAALGSLFLLLVLFSIRQITDYDLGYHLGGGRWILENHRFPSNDPHTYTVPDRPYIDLHWLYQVLLYSLYRLGSYPLLTLFNTMMIAAVFLLTFKRLRQTGAPLGLCVLLFGAAVLGCELRFLVRPEILSWLLMSLTLWILEERFNNKPSRLFLLPIIMLFWVNLEGLFGMGLGLMAFYLLSGFLHSGRIDKKLLRYSGLAAAACLLNPYFLKGFLFPLKLLETLRTFKHAIKEFLSPWTLANHSPYVPDWTLWTYKLFCFFLLFLLLATFKKRKVHEFLLAGVFLYLSATAMRNISLFMLACLPLAAASWRDLKWDWFEKFQARFLWKPGAAWLVLLLALGLCSRVLSNAYYTSERRFDLFGLGLNQDQMPVRAAEFLVQNRLDGRILNHMNTGGWLIWKGPQKVFIDGRLEVMGLDLFKEYDLVNRPGGLPLLLDKRRIDIAFFNSQDAPRWALEMGKARGWRAAYFDESGAVYLREGYAPEIPALDFNRELAKRNLTLVQPEEAKRILQGPRVSKPAGFWMGFYKPSAFPYGPLNLANFCSYNNGVDAAEAFFLQAIRDSQGKYDECFLGLGAMYHYLRKYEEASLCVRRVLERDPDNQLALKILRDIPSP